MAIFVLIRPCLNCYDGNSIFMLRLKPAGASRSSRTEMRKRSNVGKYNEECEEQVQLPDRPPKTSLNSTSKHQHWREINAPWMEPDNPNVFKSTLIRLKGSCDCSNSLDENVKFRPKGSPCESFSPVYVNRNQFRNNYCVAENLNNNNSVGDHLLVWKKPTSKPDQPRAAINGEELPNLVKWIPQREGDTQPLVS